MQIEQRVFPFEMRVSEGDIPVISGTGVVYNQLSVVMWGYFREKIALGAFSDSIAKRDVKSLWNHNTDYPLGRTGNQTLRLTEDSTGIHFECDPPQTSWGNDAVISIRRRDVSQCSFGFVALDSDWEIDNDEQLIRTVVKGELWEISPVPFPAYPQTEVDVRSAMGKADLAAFFEKNPNLPDWVQARLAGTNVSDAQVRAAYRGRVLQLLK